MPIETGTMVGGYEVQEPLGQGAMGIVYRAWHTALERPAAVKVMQSLAPDPEAVARFQREARSIAQLRHPNILSVFDFGNLEGTPYMVVEYMPGGSLGDRLRADPMAPAEAVATLRGVGAALDHAHGRGIVHRDVKPANVLIAADGTPVLADFGLVKLLESSTKLSMTGTTTGTPSYMAPEQVKAETVGPAADRYALACVAYELLTGTVPFNGGGGGILQVLYAHVHETPEPASVRRPGLPAELDGVLARGMAKDPDARWPSCAAMVAAMAAALEAAPGAEAMTAAPAAPATARLAPTPVAATEPVPVVAPVPAAAPIGQAGRRGWRRPLIVLGVFAACLAGALLLAAAFTSRETVSVNPGSAAVGADITVTAHHIPPDTNGTLQVDGHVIDSFRSDGSGDLRAVVRIPREVAIGAHQLDVCWAGSCHLRTPLTVT